MVWGRVRNQKVAFWGNGIKLHKELLTELTKVWRIHDSIPVPGVHSLPESRNKRFHIKSLAFSDNVLEEPVQELAAVLDVLVGVGDHAADGREHLVKQWKHRLS